jgi:DNA-binding CsgD family transcriptional regulator/HAMP domain-containing protein
MTRKLITAALLSGMCCLLPAKEPVEPLLRELDAVLANASAYEGYFLQRVEVLRQMLQGRNSPEQEYEIRRALAAEFSSYSMDSTIVHLSRNRALARQMGDAYRQGETDFALAREYALAGYHSDALDIVSSYRLEEIPQGLEYPYFEVCNYLYGELAAYSSNNAQYWQKRDMYRVSMFPYLEEGSYEWYDQHRVQAEADRERDKALEYAMQALDVTEPNSRTYARAAFFVSTYQRDPDDRLAWLARSAIADAMCATKDYASLNDLAHMLYDRGDIERAFQYVADHGMPDALFFGGKLRPWQIAQFFPDLQKAYAARSARNTRRMWGLIGVAFILLLALAGLLFYLSRRQRVLVRTRKELEESKARVERRNQTLQDVNEQLQALNGELQESNKVRQEYIALFLQSLSENISTTRQYKNHVLKYIRRGNDKYLIEEIEALPPIEEDIQEFNRMFDETFINLYPDFVEQFNALLVDGEAITPRGDDILTPELRVFALIKLGITESSRIASLLHYSANTVYNYRAKIKNKARGDRELFEEAVRAIE